MLRTSIITWRHTPYWWSTTASVIPESVPGVSSPCRRHPTPRDVWPVHQVNNRESLSTDTSLPKEVLEESESMEVDGINGRLKTCRCSLEGLEGHQGGAGLGLVQSRSGEVIDEETAPLGLAWSWPGEDVSQRHPRRPQPSEYRPLLRKGLVSRCTRLCTTLDKETALDKARLDSTFQQGIYLIEGLYDELPV